MPSPRSRQIGQGHRDVLKNFEHALRDWVIPFLVRWADGTQPRPSTSEIETLRHFVNAQGRPPSGYAWLPRLLDGLSGSLRFNTRNLVNIHPSPHVPSVAASTIVALQNPNNIVAEVSAATSAMEDEVTRWMAKELVGFDPELSKGSIVGGGTIANLTALLVARDYAYRKLARPRPAEIRERGLFGHPPGVVLATAGSHYSVRKALWVLGVGDENVVTIPVAYDERLAHESRRDTTFVKGITNNTWKKLINDWTDVERARGKQELENFYAGGHEPFSLQPLNSEVFKALYSCFEYSTPLLAYVFTLGTTDTGTIEHPDSAALQMLAREDVFIHADAAIGGFALLHPRIRKQAVGLKAVHSVTIDGHKFGFLAYPNASILFREREWMLGIMHEAPYLKNLAPTIEGSRPGTHVAALWAVTHDLGVAGFKLWFERLFAFTNALIRALKHSRFQILNKVDLTTLAIAPKLLELSRREINQIVVSMEQAIRNDDSEEAWLINIDKGLSSIKVRDTPTSEDLVDLYCLRMVAVNPAMLPRDAAHFVSYLEDKLDQALYSLRRSSAG